MSWNKINKIRAHGCIPVISGSTKGSMGVFAICLPPPPPALPPSEGKMAKTSHFGQILRFCPLRNTFCPTMHPSTPKNILVQPLSVTKGNMYQINFLNQLLLPHDHNIYFSRQSHTSDSPIHSFIDVLCILHTHLDTVDWENTPSVMLQLHVTFMGPMFYLTYLVV